MTGRQAIATRTGAVLFAASLLLLWQYLVDHRVLSPIFVAAPTNIAAALIRLTASGELWEAFSSTMVRMLVGWVLAALLGVGLGAVLGLSLRLTPYLRPMLEFLRQLPAAVVIPPAILFLGLSEQMMVAVIAFGVVWPILLSTIHGFVAIEPRLREVSATLEMSSLRYFRTIAIPAAMADILAGVRISLAIALILTIVVEMQAGFPGMGRHILLAQRSFRAPDLYAGIVVVGAFGFVLNVLASWADRYFLRWRAALR